MQTLKTKVEELIRIGDEGKMSESPERKVLKDTIGKLKTKNITSLTNYFQVVKVFNENLEKLLNSLIQSSAKYSLMLVL